MSQPPALHVLHRARSSAIESETSWTLRETDLLVAPDGAQSSTVPLATITRLSLLYDPSRVQPNRFRCRIQCMDGRRFTFRNEHYSGFASFEDRSTSYRHLVTALCQRTSVANPTCVFASGKSWAAYWIQLAFLALGLLALVVILFIAWSVIGWVVILKLILLALMMPMLVRWVRRNRPGTFDPANPPERMLPNVDQA